MLCRKTVAAYCVNDLEHILCVVSGFRREVNEICALLGYDAAYSGNSLTIQEDKADRFSQNVGKELPP